MRQARAEAHTDEQAYRKLIVLPARERSDGSAPFSPAAFGGKQERNREAACLDGETVKIS